MYTSLQWIARTDPCRCSVVFFGTFPRRTLSATPKGLTVHTRQPPTDSRFPLFFLSYSKLMPVSLSEYVRSSIHPFSGMVVSKKKKKRMPEKIWSLALWFSFCHDRRDGQNFPLKLDDSFKDVLGPTTTANCLTVSLSLTERFSSWQANSVDVSSRNEHYSCCSHLLPGTLHQRFHVKEAGYTSIPDFLRLWTK